MDTATARQAVTASQPVLAAASASEYYIEVSDLVKLYGDTRAVDGISLRIRKGEVFAFLGPNGAGKTTTVEMLEGLTVPDTGSIELLGCRWGEGRDRQLRAARSLPGTVRLRCRSTAPCPCCSGSMSDR